LGLKNQTSKSNQSEYISVNNQLQKLPTGVKFFSTTVHTDNGKLLAIESTNDTPFDIKRVYTLFGNPNDITRGCHAHIGMQQLILNITGSFELLLDDGITRTALTLEKPGQGVLLEGIIWRELKNFSPNSVINCFADKNYDDCIYIRDYDDFKSTILKTNNIS